MKKFNIKTLAMLLALTGTGMFVMTVNASGSFNPSASVNYRKALRLQINYNDGKRVFHRKIACDTCPLPSNGLNKNTAGEVIQLLNSRADLMKLLSNKERTSAVYYLKKRHKLS